MKWVIIMLLLASFVLAGCGTATTTAKPDITITGKQQQEGRVGGDVTWELTIKNNGPGTLGPYRISFDYGGMDVSDITPAPVSWSIKTYPQFAALPSGQSVTITIELLATKVGVANGSAFLDDYEQGARFKTTVR